MTTFQITFNDDRFKDRGLSPEEKADLIILMIEEGVAFLSDGFVSNLEVRQIDEAGVSGSEIAADASSLSSAEMCDA